jgi:hypothetical protein
MHGQPRQLFSEASPRGVVLPHQGVDAPLLFQSALRCAKARREVVLSREALTPLLLQSLLRCAKACPWRIRKSSRKRIGPGSLVRYAFLGLKRKPARRGIRAGHFDRRRGNGGIGSADRGLWNLGAHLAASIGRFGA